MAHLHRAVLPAAACLAAGMVIAAAGGASPAFDLPDLVGDAPARPYLERYTVDHHGIGQVNRLLLRFDGYVRNDGDGPLDLQGNPSGGTMAQYVQPAGGGALQAWSYGPGEARPQFTYATDDGHDHWHLRAAVEYSLWDTTRTTMVRPGSKTGFCLYDIDRMGTQGPVGAVYDGPATGDFCNRGNPAATTLRTGVSAGWRDVYDAGLALQWIDVSDLAPGRYVLAARPDPDDVIREADETNNGEAFAPAEVTVPGYVAQPVAAATRAGRTVTVTLSAATMQDATAVPGTRRFRIRTVPPAGTLTTAAGAPLAAGDALPEGAATVRYTAPAGYAGTAAFAYTAEDVNSMFPTDGSGTPQGGAVQATATVTVGPAAPLTVGIAGAPATMAPGTVAALRAVVAGGDGGVTWSVRTAAGATAGAGTVNAAGRYVAPASAPAGGVVVVRATSDELPTARAEVRIRIGGALPGGPAPSPGAELPPGVLLSRPGVQRIRGTHIATVRSAVRGGLVITAERGGRRIAGCSSGVLAGQSVTCRMTLPGAAGVRIVARLRAADGRRRTTAVALEPLMTGLGPLTARRDGRAVVAAVTALRAGTVAITVRRGRAVVGRCLRRAAAGEVVTCRRVLPVAASPLTVTARLRAPGIAGARGRAV